MSGSPNPVRIGRGSLWAAGAAVFTMAWSVSLAPAQTQEIKPTVHIQASAKDKDSSADSETITDSEVKQAGCSSCGGGSLPPSYVPFSTNCSHEGCPSCCYPGRRGCDCCDCGDSCFGKLVSGFYECLCCPDPCYEPRWLPIADTAFFLDAARPVTQSRIRWDSAWNLVNPDRAEFFQAKARLNRLQIGPGGPCAEANLTGKGPNCISSRIDYDDLTLYNEAALGAFSFFTEFLYRDIESQTSPISIAAGGMECCPASGFGDMNLGTKSMLLDCELMQFTFQFKTFLPMGNFTEGLGVGHVSLEPSFLMNLKCTPDCYLQTQWAYWIPIAGDPLYQGNVFHQHYAFNKTLCKCGEDIVLNGTCELNHWVVCNGAYTADNLLLPTPGAATLSAVSQPAYANIVTVGPGIRLFLCRKLDIGVGSAFAVSGPRWAESLIRSEIRLRY